MAQEFLEPSVPHNWSEVLAGIDRPIEEARGLPNLAYTGAAFAGHERDAVLAQTWTCIGTASAIPAPGDARPADLVGLPLMTVRGHDGTVRVFHNVCSHRGHRLVTAPCRSLTVLRCPYHSWAYDFEGKLRATPSVGGVRKNNVAGFDKAKHGLREVRSTVWLDQIFVNLSGDAPAFEDHVAPLTARWADFDLSLIRHGGPESSLRFDVGCNWKLAVENYCEAYHLPWVHPGLNAYSRLEDHYNIAEENHFAGQGSTAYKPQMSNAGPTLPRFPGLPARWAGAAEYVALFPNVLLGLHCDHFYAVRLEPLAPDRTLEHFEIYYVGDAPLGPDYDGVRQEIAKNWREVFAEDLGVVQEMQRGRASPAFEGGVFTPVLEPPTHCFHKWMARALNAAPAPLGEAGRA
jgi:choline monooxygenase